MLKMDYAMQAALQNAIHHQQSQASANGLSNASPGFDGLMNSISQNNFEMVLGVKLWDPAPTARAKIAYPETIEEWCARLQRAVERVGDGEMDYAEFCRWRDELDAWKEKIV